jgi:hypothetical protein
MIALREFTNGAEMMEFYRQLKARTKALAPPPPPAPPPPQPSLPPSSSMPEPEPTTVPDPFVFARKTPLQRIILAVAREFNIPPYVLISTARTRDAVVARQVVALLGRDLTNCSTVKIGRVLGGRDHTTILHAFTAIKNKIASDPALAGKIQTVRDELLEVSTEKHIRPAVAISALMPNLAMRPPAPGLASVDAQRSNAGCTLLKSQSAEEFSHDNGCDQDSDRERDQRPGGPDAESSGSIIGCRGNGH